MVGVAPFNSGGGDGTGSPTHTVTVDGLRVNPAAFCAVLRVIVRGLHPVRRPDTQTNVQVHADPCHAVQVPRHHVWCKTGRQN